MSDSSTKSTQRHREWVIGSNWWLMPLAAMLISLLCVYVFREFKNGATDAILVTAMNSAMFSTSYLLVVLLSPGFAVQHAVTAVAFQFLTPYLFARIDSGYEAWLTAQLLVTAGLFIVHRLIVTPSWRHERYPGRVRHTFSIRGLLILTVAAALTIVGLQASGLRQDFYVIVTAICGPPFVGSTAALFLSRLRPREMWTVVGISIMLLIVTCILDWKGSFHVGFSEIEPPAMVSGFLATLVVISLFNLLFLKLNSGRVHD